MTNARTATRSIGPRECATRAQGREEIGLIGIQEKGPAETSLMGRNFHGKLKYSITDDMELHIIVIVFEVGLLPFLVCR